MLLDIAKKEFTRMDKMINKIQNTYDFTATSELICNKNKKSYRWRYKNKGLNTYSELPKSDIKTAQRLAKETYYYYLLQDCICEKKALEYYIKHQSLENGKGAQYLQNPEVRRLLKIEFQPENEDLLAWQNAKPTVSPIYPEQLTVKSATGRMVRSKTEATIDLVLTQNKIPFRYEEPLVINGIELRPDFTIRHPKTGKYFYWEHLGRMGDDKYVMNAGDKIKLYASAGYYPFINLIITSETANQPADLEFINIIIEHFFCI